MTPRKVMLQTPASQPLTRQPTQSTQQQIQITRTNTQDFQMSLKDNPSHHDHSTAADVSDGRHSAQPVYSQHTQCHITEHARYNTQVRVLHWNDQGLNSSAKQSALIVALQLGHIDATMIQDSRIVAKKDGIPHIRVPNCYIYFKPA